MSWPCLVNVDHRPKLIEHLIVILFIALLVAQSIFMSGEKKLDMIKTKHKLELDIVVRLGKNSLKLMHEPIMRALINANHTGPMLKCVCLVSVASLF